MYINLDLTSLKAYGMQDLLEKMHAARYPEDVEVDPEVFVMVLKNAMVSSVYRDYEGIYVNLITSKIRPRWPDLGAGVDAE